MNDIYQTPEAELEQADPNNAHDYKLYKVSGIGIATLVGTILAGGYLMAVNHRRLGNADKAKSTLVYSFLTFVGILVIAFLIPEDMSIPDTVFTVAQVVAMVAIAKQWFEQPIIAHRANGGLMASNWKAFGISLLFMIVLGLLFWGALMLFVFGVNGEQAAGL